MGPPAGISGCTLALELENKASIKGPDVLFSDNVPGLRNTPEKIYYKYKNIFPSLGSLDNKVACHYVSSRLAYFNATLMLTKSALRDHVYGVVEKCDGKTAHRWGIWLLSERERSSDPHH